MGGESVPLNYIPIAVFAVLALGFGVVSLLAGWIVRPSRPYRAKLLPYESGSPLFMDARVQFPMRYYIIAMLFVVFVIQTKRGRWIPALHEPPGLLPCAAGMTEAANNRRQNLSLIHISEPTRPY